ncbi:hypothetical protein FJT64_014388 [Amphibalanus amphitrite]|uniref:Uncharacterized protein n=1 Tax=Amphibalanus amphitrite TaxID=1232801 RepID=A0A6A4VA56_AMPAM|nr:hypothetical protein FJT64_014388 [Amphibalanus amphitrite]
MSNYRGGGRRAGSQAATSEDARTPIAWQHRDMNYHQHQSYSDRHRSESASRRGPGSVSDQTSHTERPPRQAAPVAYRGRPPPQETDASTSASSECSSDTKVTIHDRHRGPAVQLVPLAGGGGPPTIRSAQSVPLLLGPPGAGITWDGEPCPVHHHGPPPPPMAVGPMSLPPPPRAASLYELRVGTPHSAYAPDGPLTTMTVDRKGRPAPPGSALGRPMMPPGLMPPMMRPRPIVRAENGAARELPVRDPRKASLVPPSEPPPQRKEPVKCGGFKKVMLISLSVIVLGVILAVALIFITK